MPKLLVLVGLPGSGKSSSLELYDQWASEIKVKYDGEIYSVYSSDNYIQVMADELGKTYDEVFQTFIKDATGCMNDYLKYWIADKSNVVWDQTNMSDKKRRGILSRFPKTYQKNCLCVVPPRNNDEWAELRRRLANRPGKTIPYHVLQSMLNSYTRPSLDEGFDSVKIVDLYGKEIHD